MPLEEDEYEIVPVGPIRRIERRVEKMERSGGGNEMVKELIDVVRTNQKIVDEVVKINSEMINRVTELSAHVQQMTEKVNDFMSRIDVEEGSPSKEVQSTPEADLRIEKLEKRINSLLLSTM